MNQLNELNQLFPFQLDILDFICRPINTFDTSKDTLLIFF